MNRKRYDWTGVDWSKPDAQIAADLGCTRVAVHRHRKAFEIDPPVKQRKAKPIRAKEWKQRARAVLAWLATPDDADAEEIAAQTDAMIKEASKLTAR